MTVVALAATSRTARRAAPLLEVLGRRAAIVSWHRWCDDHEQGELPDAIVATDVACLDLLPDLPTAVWVSDAAGRERAERHGAAVVLTDRADLAGDGVLLVRDGALDVARVEPTAPLVRSRLRDVAGRPEVLVVTSTATRAVDEAELRRASAVVATDGHLPLALAVGAPIVTTAESAARLGLEAGRHVVVGVDEEPLDTALRLALDPERSARCSAEGRRFAEEHLDLGPVALAVGRALGVEPATPVSELTALAARLDELAAPPDGWVRRRTTDLVAAVDGDLGQTRAMSDPRPVTSSNPTAQRARRLLGRAVDPLRARVKGALAAAAAQGQADLRAEVDLLQRDLEQTRRDHAAELAVLHEELAALQERGTAPPTPC